MVDEVCVLRVFGLLEGICELKCAIHSGFLLAQIKLGCKSALCCLCRALSPMFWSSRSAALSGLSDWWSHKTIFEKDGDCKAVPTAMYCIHFVPVSLLKSTGRASLDPAVGEALRCLWSET